MIELLVVISIIAIIIGLGLPNFLGSRERARDYKRKSEINQMKAALRLYYNDYNMYPASGFGIYLNACGPNGTSQCGSGGAGVCTTADFAAGGTDGCQTIYMRRLPKETNGTNSWKYYQCSGADDFRLKTDLIENKSDPDLAASQSRCPATSCGLGSWGATDYVVCAD